MPDRAASEQESDPAAAGLRGANGPSRVRYRILAMLCALSMITYLDRASLGAAAPSLVAELSLGSEAELKWAFAAFAIAYALFEIPTGWLGDTLGPRGTLLRIVAWWSLCTASTALVGLRIGGWMLGGLGTLIVLRFLFGAGEAGAYPNITRALHNWFPAGQRATAQGFIWMSGRLVGGLTPLLFAVLVTGTEWTAPLTTWRGSFVLLGLIGCAWCAMFALLFRNRPGEHPRVNAAELAQIGGGQPPPASHAAVPWRAFLRSGNLWLLCGMYFCLNFGWSFHLTYLPSYLPYRFHLGKQNALGALYSGGPLWLGAVGCLLGGLVADQLLRRTGDPDRARRRLCSTSLVLAGLSWLAAICATSVHGFALAVSLAAFFNDLTMPSAWAVCQNIGGRFAGVAAACMNTIGTLGSVAAIWLTGMLVERSLAIRATALGMAADKLPAPEKHAAALAGYDWGLVAYAAAYLLAAGCWWWIDPSRTIIAQTTPADPA
jgi:MFS transporter, ACS family, glucarate transporter